MYISLFRKYTSLVAMLVIAGMSPACKSSHPSHVPFVKRTWHTFTAHFNGYFNAREVYRTSIAHFEESYTESYDQPLPVIRLPSKVQAQNLAADMETVIKKLGLVIERHEAGERTDDAYLLVGKANFYQHDFYHALENLQYVYNEYEDPAIRQEALAWIGLTYMMQHNDRDAATAFDIALSNIGESPEAAPFVRKAAAHYYMVRDDIPKAITLLRPLLEEDKASGSKVRDHFVLAQLYQQAGQADSAVVWYNRILEQKPPYEVIFNARIKIALLQDVSDGGQAARADIQEMMEDERNADYMDQLYFVLGDIEERKGEFSKAIGYYTRSADTSTVNQNQKGISYLRIAGIHLKDRDYELASTYFDSTMTFLSSNYPQYGETVQISGKLKSLRNNQQLIVREDSLQALGRLPLPERSRIAEEKVKELIARAEKEREAAESNMGTMTAGVARAGNTLTGRRLAGGDQSWYFYNPTALSQGFNDFQRRWGNRPNEDNWRRSNKQVMVATSGGPGLGGEELSAEVVSVEEDPELLKEELLAGIPVTPEQVDSSNLRIAKAHYIIAGIYDNDLKEYEKALQHYEALLERYPGYPDLAAVYYSLYKIYQVKAPERSETYKKRILNDFPQSEYAAMIRNPGMSGIRNARQANELERDYAIVYQTFREGDYQSVIEQIDSISWGGTDPSLGAKTAYLKALSVGYTHPVGPFTASLEELSAAYPQEELGQRATHMLEYIALHPDEFEEREVALYPGGAFMDFDAIQRLADERARAEAAAFARAREEEERNSYFKRPAENATYKVVIAVADPRINLNSTRFGIGQLNRRRYADENYQHESKKIPGDMQLVAVGAFASADDARDYYNMLIKSGNNVVRAPANKTDLFYITSDNFERLTDQEKVREYRYYFRVNAGKMGEPEAVPVPPALTATDRSRELRPARPADAAEENGQPEAKRRRAEPATGKEQSETKPGTLFVPDHEGSEFLVVVAVHNPRINLNSTRAGIGLFNRGYYSRRGYEHRSATVNNETQLIAVHKFRGKAEVTKYFSRFKAREEQIVRAPEEITSVFFITTDNFAHLSSQKMVAEYMRFFRQQYGKEE